MNITHMLFSALILFAGTSLLGAAKNYGTYTTELKITIEDFSGIENVPNEILESIAEFLDPKSLGRIAQASKRFELATLNERVKLFLKLHRGNPQTALFDAATNNIPTLIGPLIQRGADVNAANGFGKTAVVLAAIKGHEKVVTELLNNGASYYKNCYAICTMKCPSITLLREGCYDFPYGLLKMMILPAGGLITIWVLFSGGSDISDNSTSVNTIMS